MSPSATAADRPVDGDALCFQLGVATGARLRLGRAVRNDVVISDATVSREHLVLASDDTGHWSVELKPGANAVMGSNRLLVVGTPLTLTSEDRITLGGVTLTFYDARGFLLRLGGQMLGKP